MQETLNRIDELWRDIDDITLEVRAYRDKATNTAARPTDDERVQSGRDSTKLNVVEQYIMAETEKIAAKQEELRELINVVRAYLDKMPGREERNVISQYYIMHRTPAVIAESLGYTERHVRRLLRSGVSMLNELSMSADVRKCPQMSVNVRKCP